MGSALGRRLRQEHFESSLQEATLNILVAADHLRGELERAVKEYGISAAQYNVLRILRGAGSSGHMRCELARRLVDRSPDVTRLLDRLEAAGLVTRAPGVEDRRATIARITDRGLELIRKAEGPMRESTTRIMGRLTAAQLREMSNLLELVYGEPDEGSEETEVTQEGEHTP